ncbi:MAG: universal stress protein [Verrucomicrobiales bacterium]
MLHESAERFIAAGYGARPHLMTGNPKHLLVELAETIGIECIYMASRGLHHAQARRLGSVAAAVAARAPCTVEIVRPSRPTG